LRIGDGDGDGYEWMRGCAMASRYASRSGVRGVGESEREGEWVDVSRVRCKSRDVEPSFLALSTFACWVLKHLVSKLCNEYVVHKAMIMLSKYRSASA
jgi:hypothetical protein